MGRKMKKRVRGHLYFLHDFKRVDEIIGMWEAMMEHCLPPTMGERSCMLPNCPSGLFMGGIISGSVIFPPRESRR